MKNDSFQNLMMTLDRLEQAGIGYTLCRVREDSIMIQAAAPGQRWEIEVMRDGTMEIEVFQSDGAIADEGKLSELIGYYADRTASHANRPARPDIQPRPQADGRALESAQPAASA